jgi:hypothetical protein
MNHQLAKIAGPTIITFALFLGGAAVHSQSGSPGRMLFAVWSGQTGKQPDSPHSRSGGFGHGLGI